jgi:hypothetical protein
MVGSALAQGPEPLPDFNIMTPAGAVTSSANLTGSLRGTNSITVDDGVPVRPHQWLLVYVRPNCAACDKILNVFHEKPISPLVANNVVVIVGDLKVGGVNLVSKRFPWVPDSSWFLDTLNDAFKKLTLQSDSVILGMRESTIQWKLVGPLPAADNRKEQSHNSPHDADLKNLKAIVASWLAVK